jgi:hypothetical protein
MSDMYDIARRVTDEVLGEGTYADLNRGNPDPGVQAAIKRARTPPEGWSVFGTHVDIPGPLEFSTETDEAGMPLWERLIESITCPRCGMTSYNANDIREGYCGNCHDWTGGKE